MQRAPDATKDCGRRFALSGFYNFLQKVFLSGIGDEAYGALQGRNDEECALVARGEDKTACAIVRDCVLAMVW